VRLVLLSVDFETALKRARSDESRGVSKDRAFLAAHYAEFRTEWLGRDVLNLDMGSSTLAEAARSVVDWLALASRRPAGRAFTSDAREVSGT
jgi:hypothetical protein